MATINLVRLGHYFTPGRQRLTRVDHTEGTCRTALVIDAATVTPELIEKDEVNGLPDKEYVGVIFWNRNGGMLHRAKVLVAPPNDTEDTFHLSGDCPDKF